MTDAALKALAGSFTPVTDVRLSLAGESLGAIPIIDGSVTADESSVPQRRVEVTVDPEWLTDAQGAAVGRLEATLDVRRGVRLHAPDGTAEDVLWPLARVFISRVSRVYSGTERLWRIEGGDVAKDISEARWEEPTLISGADIATMVTQIATSRVPGIEVVADPTGQTAQGRTLGADGAGENDPWADIVDLAAAAAREVIIDVAGRLVLRDVPDPDSDEPAAVFTDVHVESQDAEVSRDMAYNVVVATCKQADDTVLRAVAEDTDPTSPSYVGNGRRRPYFMVLPDESATSLAQVQAAADARLRQVIGSTLVRTIRVPWTPLVDLGSVVRYADGETWTGIAAVVETPLGPGDPWCQVTTRRRRVT